MLRVYSISNVNDSWETRKLKAQISLHFSNFQFSTLVRWGMKWNATNNRKYGKSILLLRRATIENEMEKDDDGGEKGKLNSNYLLYELCILSLPPLATSRLLVFPTVKYSSTLQLVLGAVDKRLRRRERFVCLTFSLTTTKIPAKVNKVSKERRKWKKSRKSRLEGNERQLSFWNVMALTVVVIFVVNGKKGRENIALKASMKTRS